MIANRHFVCSRHTPLWEGRVVRVKNQKCRKPLKIRAFGTVFGTHGRIRTSGLPLRRRPLYPAELRGRVIFLNELEHYTARISAKGDCYNITLGGGRSIQLSYVGRCEFILAFWEENVKAFFPGMVKNF